MARNDRRRRSAIDGRTTRHAGYGVSQRRRKRVEEVFGWLKTVGGGRKLRYVGQARNRSWMELAAAAYSDRVELRAIVRAAEQVKRGSH